MTYNKAQTADPYDPDMFDWGDDIGGIDVQDVSPTVVEDIIMTAIDSCEETFGWRWLRPSARGEVAKKLYRVRHVVSDPKVQAWVEQEWPEFTFVWDQATGHHDHPVSHLVTELNELEMVNDLVRDGKVYIDLFGNANRDARYKRKAVCLYSMATPKDYLRYQKNNYNMKLFDMEELCDPKTSLGRINDITCTHALYYMNIADIARIVNVSKDRKLRALVHRHPDVAGTFHFGEIKYRVSESGQVTQTNALTGESYTHPSLEALFHQFSAKTEFGGVTWTVRKAGGDAFFVDFVACDNSVAGYYVPLVDVRPETREVVELDGVRVSTFLHWSWMTYHNGHSVVELDDHDLFKKLRRYVSGRRRTEQLLAEVFQHARRLTNKADIISIHGGGAHEVDIATLSDYVHAAFYIDVRRELETAIAFHKANADMVSLLNNYYEKGMMPKDFTAITKVLSTVKRQVGKSVQAAGEAKKEIQSSVAVKFVADAIAREIETAKDVSIFGDRRGYQTRRDNVQLSRELPLDPPRQRIKPMSLSLW